MKNNIIATETATTTVKAATLSVGAKIGIVAAIACAVLSAGLFFYSYKLKNAPVAAAPTEKTLTLDTRAKEDGEVVNPLAGRMVFAGLEDCEITEDMAIRLDNPEENLDFLMKYEVYNGNDLVFETDLIESGKYIDWVVSENLPKGEYKLTFVEKPYYPNGDDYQMLTNGSNTINVSLT